MSDKSKIQWTDATWNPLRGCSRVSEGCRFCYAERAAARFSGPGEPFEGLARWKSRVSGLEYAERGAAGAADPTWTGKVQLVEELLDRPLRWKRPRRIFVTSMSDPFHPAVPFETVDLIFGVMAKAWWHTFQLLTKRPERMLAYLQRCDGGRHYLAAGQRFPWPVWAARRVHMGDGETSWPLANVHLGVSVENQTAAAERIPPLLQTPAAVRWISAEPLLGPVELMPSWLAGFDYSGGRSVVAPRLEWVVVGGESGPGARPCDLAWIRGLVAQCAAARVPAFVKQLGARPELRDAIEEVCNIPCSHVVQNRVARLRPADRKGGDPAEWPADLRVRQFPELRS